MKKAVFLDRDGVIIDDPGFVHKIDHYKLLDHAADGLKILQDDGFLLIVITNQSGIGRKIFTTGDFHKINSHMLKDLHGKGIKIAESYFCPHTSDEGCECRKPKTKFIMEAKSRFSIDLKNSYVIGDRKSDIELGKNAGCHTVHVLTGHSKDESMSKPDFTAKNLLEAAEWVVKNDRK